MPLSSPDPAEVSSSEEGEATAAAVSTSEDEDHADLEGRLLVLSNFFKSLSVPEEFDRVVGSTSAASSDSSTISPTTAVLLCQDTIAAGGPVTGGLMLARVDSVSSVSSPFVGCHSVSDGLQQLVIVEDGGQGSAELLKDSSIEMPGEGVSPSVDADDVQCRGIHKCAQVNVGSADDEQQVVVGYLQLRDFMVSQSSFSLCDVVADGVGSEEVRPVIREEVRPQPADGLGQPPRSTVEPVVERAVGIDQAPEHRSFATVVNPDRWADVELAFDPPHDGGVAAESETTGADISWEQPGSAGRGDGERWYRD
ncbi:hypothetical protein Dimus_015981 [Dionaea muscipula]